VLAVSSRIIARAGLNGFLRRPGTCQHPLRYLLLTHFVGLRLSELSQPIDSYIRPFGRAPWPCLNQTSDHFGHPLIKDCVVAPTAGGRSLVGRFTCQQCEMSYLRVGPDRLPDDRFRRYRIPNYGAVWENTLRQLWDARHISFRALCGILGVDSRTARRQASRLGLAAVLPGSARNHLPDQRPKMAPGPKKSVATVKSAWLAGMLAHPKASKTQLRQMRPDLYALLYRYAKEWLNKYSPICARDNSRKIVNWVRRDRQLSNSLNKAPVRLLNRIPLVRLTRTALLRESSALWALGEKRKLLPLAHRTLDRLTESRTDFAARRIIAVAELCSVESEVTPEWALVRKAGLRPDMIQDPAVRNALARVRRQEPLVVPFHEGD
jgi:hypothetical protein